MSVKEIKTILIVINSTNNFGGKYPIGNKELHQKVLKLEIDLKIRYDQFNNCWILIK